MLDAKTITNVLITCTQDTGVGGVQLVVRDLVHTLEQHGRRVDLLYPEPLPSVRLVERMNPWGRPAFYCPMPAIVRDNELLSVPLFLAYLPIVLGQLVRLIRQRKIDVINCHYLSPYFIHLVLAGRLLHVPVLISVHGADIDSVRRSGPFQRLLLGVIMWCATRIVACSQALARQTTQTFPQTRQKVFMVHNGLDVSHYTRHIGSAPAISGALPQPYLLCVCRHVHKKGIDTLLAAFALVLRECPGVSLVLVGDGPLLDTHKALARELAIDRSVMFTGDVDHAEVSAFFDACTLFVLPSRAEPFGLVLLEAAYFRKAIVATRVGGIPEIITDGVNGLLVAANDAVAIASKIVGLLKDPIRAEQLGQRAYETLMTRFLWNDRIRDYITIYEGRPAAHLQEPKDEPADAFEPIALGQLRPPR